MVKHSVRRFSQPITIVGLGAVGTALARAFAARGARDVTLISPRSAPGLRLPPGSRYPLFRSLEAAPLEKGIVILTVPDNRLKEVIHRIAAADRSWPNLSLFHTSGPLGSEILDVFSRKGAGVAAWHPYQTFPRLAKSANFSGITFGISGNPRGMKSGFRLARYLGGLPVRVSNRHRVLYHASAVMACGFVAANLQAAVTVLRQAGFTLAESRRAVLQIASATIRNVQELGVKAALTGPAVREDRETIRRHLRELHQHNPEVVDIYKYITRYTESILPDPSSKSPPRSI